MYVDFDMRSNLISQHSSNMGRNQLFLKMPISFPKFTLNFFHLMDLNTLKVSPLW